MVDVVVVGSLMIDLVSVTERIPKLGETIHGRSFAQNFGGKGANQCVAARRLGASTAMVGNVGDDSFGNDYRRELENIGSIKLDHLKQVGGQKTGIASIWVDSKGQNSIIITANANEKLGPSDVRGAEGLCKSAKIVVCQLEVPQEASVEALKLAKKHKARSIFNPAPAIPGLNEDLLRYADIICPNETEAELLCGFPVDSDESYQKYEKSFPMEKDAILRRLRTRLLTPVYVKTLAEAVFPVDICCTFESDRPFTPEGSGRGHNNPGEKGAVFATRESKDFKRVAAPQVEVVDSTGAGDAFISALAFFLAKNGSSDLASAIGHACKYASASVQKSGTQASFPSADDLPGNYFN